MFTPAQKRAIAMKVQAILQETAHDELPDGEIHFILHVDGAENWSYANIRNGADADKQVPEIIIRNLTV